jgi:hypothetical protein
VGQKVTPGTFRITRAMPKNAPGRRLVLTVDYGRETHDVPFNST